jgi:hypothetical protein
MDDMTAGTAEFSVFWWDCNGWQHTELQRVRAKHAVDAAYRLSYGPASVLGMVARVIITDGGDCTVFLWTHENGLVLPAAASRSCRIG